MTDVVARAAKRQLLMDRYAEILTDAGDPHAIGRARQLVEEAEDAGWAPPITAADDRPPAPSYSTREGRDRAKQLLADALAARTKTTDASSDAPCAAPAAPAPPNSPTRGSAYRSPLPSDVPSPSAEAQARTAPSHA